MIRVLAILFLLTVLPAISTVRQLVFVSNLQVSKTPTGPWSNILTTILPVDISEDTKRFYRPWVDIGP